MLDDSKPVWAAVNDVPRQYPWLSEEIECSACIIGGGLTGALCALRLAEEGEDVVLITSGQVGYSSTADAAPCVSFDFGHKIVELKRKLGTDYTLRLFDEGARALDMLEYLSTQLDGDFGFRRCDSLLYTNDERDLELFNREYLMRKHNGFDCSFMNRTAARDAFSFPIAGGIFSKGLAAYFDPYKLTHLCLEKARQLGAKIFENTKATQLDSHGKCVVIETSTYQTVFADKCVLAVGSAFEDILNVPTHSFTNFYSVSTPVDSYAGWAGKCVVKNWDNRGITLSPTPDQRIYCGGLRTSALDENGKFYGVLNVPSLTEKRFEEIENTVRCHFPAIDIDNFEITRAPRCTVTADSLPIIGADENHAKCYFACCTGSDGALYSVLAADIIAENIKGNYSEESLMFSPMRFTRKQMRSR